MCEKRLANKPVLEPKRPGCCDAESRCLVTSGLGTISVGDPQLRPRGTYPLTFREEKDRV